MQTIKQRLTFGEVVPVFAIARLVHPVVIRMFGLTGKYRGFWLDQEHAHVSTDQIVAAVLAGRTEGMDCFVRVPPTGYWQVTQCLEAGASGVMAAQIHSVEQAQQFVDWCRFSPRGQRGLNANGFDADYSFKPPAKFVEDSNRDVFVAIQIETPGAVEDADQIAALEGVDHLFIGPADLSLSLGVVGQFHHEKLWSAIDRVAEACRKHGKTWGAVTPDPQFAARALANGCRLPTMGNDMLVFRRGLEYFGTAFADQFGK